MTERRARIATALLALVGAAIAGYLSYTRLNDTSIMCPTSGCGTVQRSSYAELAGVPVAYLGVVGYLAIALSARRCRTRAMLVFAAAVLAGYLLFAQVVLLRAVCVWCVASDVVLLLLLAVTVLRGLPRYDAVSPTGDRTAGSASS